MDDHKGLCCICGKEIPAREDGQGDNVVANIEIHPPRYPTLITSYKNRWICSKCAMDIAVNVCKNDSLI